MTSKYRFYLLFQKTHIFINLDLRNIYKLIKMKDNGFLIVFDKRYDKFEYHFDLFFCGLLQTHE